MKKTVLYHKNLKILTVKITLSQIADLVNILIKKKMHGSFDYGNK